MNLTLYPKLFRVKQWVKNFLVFLPLFLSKDFLKEDKIILGCLAFLAFCFMASSVYLMNDWIDRKQDSLNIFKKNRPIAAGLVGFLEVAILFIILFLLTSAIIWVFFPQSWWVFLLYLALNVVYSFYLKKVPILELFIVPIFYLIRIIFGSLSIGVVFSNWILLWLFFICLSAVSVKRLAESHLEHGREVISFYSTLFLRNAVYCFLFLFFVSHLIGFFVLGKDYYSFISVALCILPMSRFVFLVHTHYQSKDLEKLIKKDLLFWSVALLWLFFLVVLW